MKIGIIGGGSIGLLLSSYLHKQHDVSIYVRREEQKNLLNNQGLFLANISHSFAIHTLLIHEIQAADCFIVCVKQHQLGKILPILKRLNKETPILFLQNGMGHIKYLQEMHHNLYVGVVEHGALRKSDNHVIHTGKGTIKIATYTGDHEQLNDLTEQLNQSRFPFEKVSDWKKLLANKLIINAVINPLTTVFDVPNRQILTNPYILHLADKLCYEAALVLELNYETQLDRVKEIASLTGENISSMLMDVRVGRQTENEAISGYLIANSNHDIPYTSFVYNSIKALERKNRFGTFDD